MYAVVELPGNGLDQPQAAGPFDSYADAEDWAHSEELATTWVVVEMFDPEVTEPPF
jgi:hypothetical protein